MITGQDPPRKTPRKWSPRKPPKAWKYRCWIRTLPSMISGIEGPGLIEAAHTGLDAGMALKSSGYSCVPLTLEEHREYHQIGRKAMERKYGVSFADTAKELNRVWFTYAKEVK
jgi:hypothetical protein